MYKTKCEACQDKCEVCVSNVNKVDVWTSMTQNYLQYTPTVHTIALSWQNVCNWWSNNRAQLMMNEMAIADCTKFTGQTLVIHISAIKRWKHLYITIWLFYVDKQVINFQTSNYNLWNYFNMQVDSTRLHANFICKWGDQLDTLLIRECVCVLSQLPQVYSGYTYHYLIIPVIKAKSEPVSKVYVPFVGACGRSKLLALAVLRAHSIDFWQWKIVFLPRHCWYTQIAKEKDSAASISYANQGALFLQYTTPRHWVSTPLYIVICLIQFTGTSTRW